MRRLAFSLDFIMKTWQFIGVARRTLIIAILVFASVSSSLAQTASTGATTSSVRLFAGPAICFPVTSAADNPTLPHFGWGLGGGVELKLRRVIAARLGADLLLVGQSPVSPEGILYRAWEGLRISLEAGYTFPIGSMTLCVLAGGGLTAADYSKTSLIFAYPSILAQAGLDIPIGRRGLVRIGVPLELMLRGTYTDFSPGLSAAFAWSFPLGAQE
jgi:hypothetical protein